MTGSEGPAVEHPSVDIRITAGNPTPEEVAAATAVLAVALEQAAAEQRTRDQAGPDAWQRSQRALRGPLPATWRAFG